jgi:hypothetical protein
MQVINIRSLDDPIIDRIGAIFVQDGIDEQGNVVEPHQDYLNKYDDAVRKGDLEYMYWFLDTFGHYFVPIVREDPIYMLENADHDALIMLEEMDYISLPDLVRGIIYDDDLVIQPDEISCDLIRQIIRRSAISIYRRHRDTIHSVINECIDEALATKRGKILVPILDALYRVDNNDEDGMYIRNDILSDKNMVELLEIYTYKIKGKNM